MKKYIILTYLLSVGLILAGPLWHKRYNYQDGGFAQVTDVVMDNDYNVYLTGIANSNNDGGDVITIKYNALGTPLWATPTDRYNYQDISYSICIDQYGYSYVAGFTYDGYNYRLLVIKYNPDGTVRRINDNNVHNPVYQSYTIKLDSQGNVYVATVHGTDAWLVTFDNELNYRGSLYIDFGGLDVFNDMVITSDDKIIVTGRVETPITGSPGQTDKDMFVGKYRFNEVTGLFEEIWHYVSLPDVEYSIEKGHKVRIDAPGDVYVAGTTQTGNSQGYQHYCLWRLDRYGNLLWMFNYSDPQDYSSSPYDLAVHPLERTSYMTGVRYLGTNDSEIMTMAIDQNCNMLWRDNYNYGARLDYGYAIGITSYSVYVSGKIGYVAGDDDMITMAYWRQIGTRKWVEIYKYLANSTEVAWCNDVKQAGSYAYIVSAGHLKNPDSTLTVMYKVLDDKDANPPGAEEPMLYTQIYPQPCKDIMRITVSVPAEERAVVSLYDATGRKISNLYNGFIKTGVNEIAYEAKSLPSGVFFVRFDVGSVTKTEKVVLQR